MTRFFLKCYDDEFGGGGDDGDDGDDGEDDDDANSNKTTTLIFTDNFTAVNVS
jgi:hypothetical protein